MRLDKFCKVSRLLKRRTVSKELADHDRILVNGKVAKPSTQVKINDLITITYGQRQICVKVLEVNEVVKKEDASNMYEVIQES